VFKRIHDLLVGSACFALALCIGTPANVALAGTASADKAAAEAKARDYFTNVELIDQDGNRLKFYDEVLKDNVVVISFIFTNCGGACPLMTRNLTMIRDMLPTNVRNEITFLSISLDPVRDTPSAMKEFAQTHDADDEEARYLHRRTRGAHNYAYCRQRARIALDKNSTERTAQRRRRTTAAARRGQCGTVTSATGP
jgi:cytochrome oxidase Cu insertion factor (SCO1/SenC/PrrC family)